MKVIAHQDKGEQTQVVLLHDHCQVVQEVVPIAIGAEDVATLHAAPITW